MLELSNFANSTPFDQDLLIRSVVLVHILAELIYGGVWEILSHAYRSVANLWVFQERI